MLPSAVGAFENPRSRRELISQPPGTPDAVEPVGPTQLRQCGNARRLIPIASHEGEKSGHHRPLPPPQDRRRIHAQPEHNKNITTHPALTGEGGSFKHDLLFMFAVSCCFPLLSHAVLRCYCGDTVIKEPRFLRPRAGSPLYFFGIISEITSLSSGPACLPHLDSRNFNHLLPICFCFVCGAPPYELYAAAAQRGTHNFRR